MTSSVDDIRETALMVLWHSGYRDDDIDSRIISIVNSDNSTKIRRNAVRMIAFFRDSKFLPVLIHCLEDEDYIVRGDAFIGICSINMDSTKMAAVKNFIDKEKNSYCVWCIQKFLAQTRGL
ncbi:MAG: HEAT repeat domain-containing protein [Dehalococcoidales bacterium]|nr:HEAT repeat domain-containing protein [Dehalococcoidales bacterium]